MTEKSEAQKNLEDMAPDQFAAMKGLVEAEADRRGRDERWSRISTMSNTEFETFKNEVNYRADRDRQQRQAAAIREAEERAARDRMGAHSDD